MDSPRLNKHLQHVYVDNLGNISARLKEMLEIGMENTRLLFYWKTFATMKASRHFNLM